MIKNALAAVLLVGSVSALAGTPPLSVSSQATYLINNRNLPVWELTLTSLDNDITLQSLTLNRGNCLISMAGRGKNVNRRLGYGQTLSFTTPSNGGFSQCRPLELTVQTNKGDFTFNWQ
ncbi:hypothetical protein [Serratia liquefaciens]|uniref:hypothetical protein n=1 Tax=Serratia liquefaciens TaxID=614 RepID=UPI0021792C04|nr:hypothetical protein [Serratia liquefaciens]CAI1017385.1 Uncharacterised protein [Serratia liquefaciens]